jgi:D-3-phosphoglycerate dehydrogenase
MSIKVLINDGIHPTGEKMLKDAGFEVVTEKIEQDDLPGQIAEFDAICVRSATKVRQDLIDLGSKLKVIGRGGVGLDNIDVDYAKSKNIAVVNTPAASSRSVAELVFAHLYSIVRNLPHVNREFVKDPSGSFKSLKKASTGIELTGKTLGIIGGGRIGRATGSIAAGAGMNVLFHDPFVEEVKVDVEFHPSLNTDPVQITIPTSSMEVLLKNSDFISLHVPGGSVILGEAEFEQIKDGVGLVNCARGGVVDEAALDNALKSKKVAYAGVDVFQKEPPEDLRLFDHDHLSFSPHIGASTSEAQERVGIELAEQLIDKLS